MFGSGSGFGTDIGGRQVIDLTSLTAAQGFIIQGDGGGDNAGTSVSSAGDINGDGLDDVIVGAANGDDGGANSGEAYVVFGSRSGFGTDVAGRQVIDLTTLTAAQGFIIRGDVGGDYAGIAVSSAGDVDGDGFTDVIVGARNGDDGGSSAGEVYVVFGSNSGFGTNVGGRQVIDLTGLSAAQGFIIQGDAAGDNAGISVSSAGDINGDGFDDMVVGAWRGDDGGTNAGKAYVVFGSGSGFGTDVGGRQVIDLSTLTAAQGFIIQGDVASDQAGRSVSSAGDINGDGFDDLVVGVPDGDDGGTAAGEAYVVFGTDSGFGTDVGGRQVVDLTTLTTAEGFIIQGDVFGDEAGTSVSAAGDVNDDGFDDLIVGAPRGDDGGTFAGEAYVLFGAGFGAAATPVNTTGTAAAEILIGGLGDDTLTGDGGADVIRTGAGDDTVTVADLTFAKVDGGSGTDTLVLEGSGASFDFTALADNRTQSIEAIDFTGSGNNTLTLGLTDALNLSEGPHSDFTDNVTAPKAIVIEGDVGDTLELAPDTRGTWTLQASDVNLDGSAAGPYDVWSFQVGSNHFVKLAVDADIGVVPVTASAGDVIITEIMQNPSAVADTAGEWFELFNTTGSAIDLEGWTISDLGSNSHTITGSLVIAAGSFLVLGINSDPGQWRRARRL